MRRGISIRWLPLLTVLAMLGPVVAGLLGTIAPAFGYLPAANMTEWTVAPFVDLFRWGGFPHAVMLSVTTGFLATSLSLLITVLIIAGWHGTRAFNVIRCLLSPLLSVPHAAAAFGIAFLITPSGWVARAFSPWLTGWERPPDVLIVQDHWGLAMVVGLVAKEVPFLLLMSLAALGQVNAKSSATIAAALGYGRVTGWLKTVFPRVYAQIRLPVYVVLAYSMSTVDEAIVLGPNTPPTLSVQIVKWMSDPDLAMRLEAAAAALVQLLLVIGSLILWRGGEIVVGILGAKWVMRGTRSFGDNALRIVGLGAGVLVCTGVLLGLVSLGVWSVAGLWSYPDVLPDSLSVRSWSRHWGNIFDTGITTLLIALCATFIAVLLTLGCLEAEYRFDFTMSERGVFLLYLPLMVPQTAFLPGLQTLMLSAGLKSGFVPVVLAHLVFVLPYVFLSLSDPFRAWDVRFGTIAAALGRSANGVLWRVRLPMLLAPVLTAVAVGFAASVGQYLPTLLVGGGRLPTLTTEAVALAAGGDRRAIGVYGLAQTVAAILPFAAALLLPQIIWRNRRGLSDA